MACASDSDCEESDSDCSDVVLEVVDVLPMVLPLCECPWNDICRALWVDGEEWPRCVECANRVNFKRLPAEKRLVYMALCLLLKDAHRRRCSRGIQALARKPLPEINPAPWL